MKKEINLEELFGIHFNGLHFDDITKENIVGFAVDACHQCLDLAAENAEINWIENSIEMESDSDFSFRDSDGNWCEISIKEDSILQIKDWIK